MALTGALCGRGQRPVRQCGRGGFDAVAYAEGVKDVLHVLADGAWGNEQLPGDRRVGQTFTGQLQDPPFAGGELRDTVSAAFGIEVDLVKMWSHQCQQHHVPAITTGKLHKSVTVAGGGTK